MKDYVYRRTVAELQERSCELRRRQMDYSELKRNVRVYRLYTEYNENLLALTSRYFQGATLFSGTGIYQGHVEHSGMLEIIGKMSDLQTVVFLAGDIKLHNTQSSVLVTWQDVSQLDV